MFARVLTPFMLCQVQSLVVTAEVVLKLRKWVMNDKRGSRGGGHFKMKPNQYHSVSLGELKMMAAHR
jgi:hypothetical protein